ncbi:hypothetical protein AB1I63_05490 [Streptococcus pneumoniae]
MITIGQSVISIGLSLGAFLGLVFGYMLDNIPVGLTMGPGFGML